MTKQLLGFGAAVMTTLLALVVLWQFRVVVAYVLISLTLAAALRPLVSRLAGKHIAVRVAWILFYLVTLGSFGFLIFMTGEAAINDIQQLARTVSVRDVWKLPLWLEGSSFQQALVTRLPPPSMLFEALTGDQGQLVLPAILGFTQGFGVVVSGVVIILVLSVYWSINQIHFERLWLSLLPSSQRKQARDIWQTIEPEIGAYMRGEVIRKPPGRASIRRRLLSARIPIPGAAGVGWRAGVPDTRGWDRCGGHPGGFIGVIDQCAAQPIYGYLCAGCPDCLRNLG